MDFIPSEKAVPIRVPATANLMIDSADRNPTINPNPFDFQINKTNSILNGFFTRIGTSEVVLEWNEPNGSYIADAQVIYNGSTTTISYTGASYTAEQALGHLCSTVNTALGGQLDLVKPFGGVDAWGVDDVANKPWSFSTNTASIQTAEKLGILLPDDSVPGHQVNAPDLRPFRYLDFVSQQLTYNQELKDSATNQYQRDVLCRWYMAWDNPPTYDSLGFPILQGYTNFVERRLFNPPKQIKWEPNMPIGNVSFQVYGNNAIAPIQPTYFVSNTLGSNAVSNFLMTLQISEN